MANIKTMTIKLFESNWCNAQDGEVVTEYYDGVPEPVGDTYLNPPKWNKEKGKYEFYVNDEYPFDYIEQNGLGAYYFYSDDHTTYCNRGPAQDVGFCYITIMQPNVAYIQGVYGCYAAKDAIAQLHMTANQIFELRRQGIRLMIENKNGVVFVYALGNKPDGDMQIDILLIAESAAATESNTDTTDSDDIHVDEYQIGYDEGYAAGHSIGFTEGYEQGQSAGEYQKGYDEGVMAGWQDGYDSGYADGQASVEP